MTDQTAAFSHRKVFAILFAATLLLASGLLWQPMTGPSLGLNISWHEGFYAELRAGHVYPRWLTTTNAGLGAPSFYFYAPLPFYVSALADFLWPFAQSLNMPTAVSAMVAVFLSGCTMYFSLRTLYAPPIALIAAIVYMAMPYHFGIDLWWRAALGEIWAFVWLPVIVSGLIANMRGDKRGSLMLGAGCAGLILSHLPSFLIALCGIGGAGVVMLVLANPWRHHPRQESLRVCVKSVLTIAVAVALTAGYWFPALATLDLTDINSFMTGGFFSYKNNFILPRRPESWSAIIEIITLFMLAVYIRMFFMAVRLKNHSSAQFVVPAVGVVLAFLMTTHLSAFVWQMLPPLQRVQFPWRFLLLMDICLVFMLAHVLSALHFEKIQIKTWLAVAVALLVAGNAYPVLMKPNYSDRMVAQYSTLIRTRADADEYRTKWTDEKLFGLIVRGEKLPPVAPAFTDGRNPDFASKAADRILGKRFTPGQLVLDRFYYPDVQAVDRITGKYLAVTPQAGTGFAVINVPRGHYDIRLERVLLPQEKTGWMISGLGVLLTLFWMSTANTFIFPWGRRWSKALHLRAPQ